MEKKEAKKKLKKMKSVWIQAQKNLKKAEKTGSEKQIENCEQRCKRAKMKMLRFMAENDIQKNELVNLTWVGISTTITLAAVAGYFVYNILSNENPTTATPDKV